MHAKLPGSCLVLVPVLVLAQSIDENSVPEPTQLGVVASDETVHTTVVGSPSLIESDDSIAEIAAIQVAPSDDDREFGIRVLLQSPGQVDSLYLDPGQASQLRDEFAAFESWYERDKACEATKRCVQGVARCRPSQNVRQAFCPGFYSTSDGERGILVSTPRYSFLFPSTNPSAFVSSIDMAVEELNRRTASERNRGAQ